MAGEGYIRENEIQSPFKHLVFYRLYRWGSINAVDIVKAMTETFKSPHWPGVGKYIGLVDDEQTIYFVTEKDNIFDYFDRWPWQKRRVYQDELNAMNPQPRYYGKSLVDVAKSTQEAMNSLILKTSEIFKQYANS